MVESNVIRWVNLSEKENTITFDTNDKLTLNDWFVTKYNNKNYYFKVIKVTALTRDGFMMVDAINVGYRNKICNLDIRELIDLKLEIVTDKILINHLRDCKAYGMPQRLNLNEIEF